MPGPFKQTPSLILCGVHAAIHGWRSKGSSSHFSILPCRYGMHCTEPARTRSYLQLQSTSAATTQYVLRLLVQLQEYCVVWKIIRALVIVLSSHPKNAVYMHTMYGLLPSNDGFFSLPPFNFCPLRHVRGSHLCGWHVQHQFDCSASLDSCIPSWTRQESSLWFEHQLAAVNHESDLTTAQAVESQVHSFDTRNLSYGLLFMAHKYNSFSGSMTMLSTLCRNRGLLVHGCMCCWYHCASTWALMCGKDDACPVPCFKGVVWGMLLSRGIRQSLPFNDAPCRMEVSSTRLTTMFGFARKEVGRAAVVS